MGERMCMRNLKKRIFDITKGLPLSERESQDLAMKSFISYGYEVMVKAWCATNVEDGVDFYASEAWHADLHPKIDAQALSDAVMLYTNLVASSEPFSDVLTSLYEEILLEGRNGDGKAQFFTPLDLSQGGAEILIESGDIKSWDGVKMIGDDTCGAGSLPLGVLNWIYKVSKSKMKYVILYLNDVDDLACKASALQILSSLVLHNIRINGLYLHNCNVITEWTKPNTIMLGFKKPEPEPDHDLFKMLEIFTRVTDKIKNDNVPVFIE